MTQSEPPPMGVRQRVLDSRHVDEVREVIADRLDCNHALIPISDAEKFRARHDLLHLGPVAMWWADFGAGVRIVPNVAEENFFMLHVPLTPNGAIEMIEPNDYAIGTVDTGAMLNAGVPLTLNWQSRSPALLVWFAADALEQMLEQTIGRPVGRLKFAVGQDLADPHMRRWMDLVRMVAQDSASGPGLFTNRLTERYVEHLLAGGLLAAARHSHSDALREATDLDAKPQLVRRAMAWIEEHADRDIVTGDVAAAAGVATRTLREGFQRYVGMPPMAYVRRVRLDHARQELLVGGGRTPLYVTEVAGRWKFGNLSRFARHYWQAYGELPSETLRR